MYFARRLRNSGYGPEQSEFLANLDKIKKNKGYDQKLARTGAMHEIHL
jgi:hypothetical protein